MQRDRWFVNWMAGEEESNTIGPHHLPSVMYFDLPANDLNSTSSVFKMELFSQYGLKMFGQ